MRRLQVGRNDEAQVHDEYRYDNTVYRRGGGSGRQELVAAPEDERQAEEQSLEHPVRLPPRT